MEGSPIFVDVLGRGEAIDILPKIKRSVALCKRRHDLSFAEIATLVEMGCRGSRMPQQFIDRIENGAIDELIGPIIQWAFSEHRIQQVTDPDVLFLRPYIELVPGPYICEAARQLCGRWLKPSELALLPLLECDTGRCGCQYLSQSRRDVERGKRPSGLHDPTVG